MSKTIETTLKKLLGKGRAWRTPKGFMSDFLDLVASPFAEIKNRIINFKFTHFPTVVVDVINIENGEELFGLDVDPEMDIEERAANVEGQWSIFAGGQNYKQIELILQKKGLPVRVIENIPEHYSLYGSRTIGNGFIQTKEGKIDPIVITSKKHTFVVQADDFLTDSQIETLIDTVVKNKPAQNGVFYIPRFLRKKEIHQKMTKSQMQQFEKSQYCDVRAPGKF